MPQYTIQPTFSGGEFSPSLYSRVDIQKYGTALKKAKNAIVHPQGGISNRPGLKFLGETKHPSKKSRIIPLEISLINSFAVEMGEYYFRFYKDDGLILLSGTPYEVTHPYKESELSEVKFVQSNDVLFLVHPKYKPKKLIHYTDTNWTLESMDLLKGPFMTIRNDTNIPTVSGSNLWSGHSVSLSFISDFLNVKHQGGLLKLNYSMPASSIQTSLTAIDYQSNQALCDSVMKVTLGGTWTGSIALDRSSDSGASWTTVKFYSANISEDSFLNVTFGTSVRYRLRVASLSSGSVSYSLNGDQLVINPDLSTEYVFSLRTISSSFSPSINYSTAITMRGTWRLFTRSTWSGQVYIERSFDNWVTVERIRSYSSVSGSSINIDDSGSQEDLCQIRVRMGESFSGSISVDLSCDPYEHEGIVEILTVTNPRTATGTTITPLLINSAKNFQEGSFSDYRGYPKTVIFFQDRLCFGATDHEPQASWCSQIGEYSNFGVSLPLKDTDAVSRNLPSRKTNEIRNLVSLKDIIAFTSSSEWKLGASGDVLTPTTATQHLQDNIGSSSCEPVLIGNRALFVSPMGTVVRDIGYDYSVDGFVGGNLSIFSTHLFENYTILEMAYQQEPDSIVWCVRSDGKLLSLTYMREQQVMAWTWHETDGLFESLCSLPGDGQNDLYFIINRDGKRFVEKIGKRLTNSNPVDSFFLDSGLSYSGAPTSTVSGLSHLNGKTVSVLADGYVLPSKVVVSGSINLGGNYSKVHVGLPYETDIETMNIEIQMQDGISYGRNMKISEVRLSFLNSRSGYIGGSENHIDPIIQMSGESLGSPIALFSGDIIQPINSSFDEGGRIFFRQSDPLPVTILAIMPKVVFGG